MGARLVINADDFGYFDGISAGILEAVAAGMVTATGVMANAPSFEHWSTALHNYPQVDVGVHLNLTHGRPLTSAIATFPDKSTLLVRALSGRLPVAEIATEWRAQIERCLAAGLQIRFLNSHEHVHMLPRLFPLVTELARKYCVPFVRYTTAELGWPSGAAAMIRALLVKGLNILQSVPAGTPRLLGFGPSGRLNMAFFERALPQLSSDGVYELMCHPGHDDPTANSYPALRSYHDWTGELELLLSPRFRDALARNGVQSARFRDLPTH